MPTGRTWIRRGRSMHGSVEVGGGRRRLEATKGHSNADKISLDSSPALANNSSICSGVQSSSQVQQINHFMAWLRQSKINGKLCGPPVSSNFDRGSVQVRLSSTFIGRFRGSARVHVYTTLALPCSPSFRQPHSPLFAPHVQATQHST